MSEEAEKILSRLAIRLKFVYNGFAGLCPATLEEFLTLYYKNTEALDDLYTEIDCLCHDLMCCIEIAKGIEESKIRGCFPMTAPKSTSKGTLKKNRKISDKKRTSKKR